uniref:Catalytic domain containing protein n=1 Tax=Rhipicephalus zambeziensis TaxID=60191 RepID=A0A224YVA5_9ACAR
MLAPSIILLICCVCYGQTISESRKSGAYLTRSSLNGLWGHGFFEINWFGIPHELIGRTFAALATANPPRSYYDILYLVHVTSQGGSVTTNAPAPNFEVNSLMRGECLGYWALILESGNMSTPTNNVLYSSCFTPRPRWMRENCCSLSALSLTDMIIPGTHNSGMCRPRLMVSRGQLVYNQYESITQQLAYGIRALDIRVQWFRGEFYVTHDVVRGRLTIRQVLREVRNFVEVTGELVLLDFHRFPKGFEGTRKLAAERHERLVNLIVTELRGVLLKRFDHLKKMNEIFEGCKRDNRMSGHVVVFYNSNRYRGPYEDFLAPAIVHKWPDAQSKRALIGFLETDACAQESRNMVSIMAELTPKFPMFLVSTRRIAQLVNHDLTEYFRYKQEKCSGIISTDYFLGNGIIDVAIEANVVKGLRRLSLESFRPEPHNYCSLTAYP